MTITFASSAPHATTTTSSRHGANTAAADDAFDEDVMPAIGLAPARERQTFVTQDVFVRVLPADAVDALHEPRCREPDVHVVLPPLAQLKAISDRFTKLAAATSSSSSSSSLSLAAGRRGGRGRVAGGGGGGGSGAAAQVRLVLSATMHGHLRLTLRTDALAIASTWTGLDNPLLDPETVEGGAEAIARHPSTAMRARAVSGLNLEEEDDEMGVRSDDDEDEGEGSAWASVTVDGRDWGKVLGIGRLGGRVVACFVNNHALILYVYISPDGVGGDESVVTVSLC